MFADEIADLKDAYPARTCLVLVYSRWPQEVVLFNGRHDAAKLSSLLPVTVEVATVDHWWLCGPFGMVEDAIGVLTGLGVPRDRIHRELFYVEDEPPAETTHADAPAGPGAEVTVLLDGRSSTATVESGTPILDGAQRVRPDLPFACKGGVCGTCRALLVSGEVTMRRNYALQLERLRWSLRHAYANVPHYRAAFDAAGVHPDDCKDLADLAKYPLTSKADLRENYPFGMFAVPREQVVRVHASSGTTGRATVVGYTRDDIDAWATDRQ